ncbi:MAG: tetratricopeptide repeat protein [Bacteroidales bacterium]|nr:tetratricopeptide repeat protein [Bacteroidales bacterium]
MKKIFVSLAALFAAAAMMSAQSMADATETAKLANESLSAGEYQTALEGFKEALKMAEACGEDGLELVATCKDIIPKTLNAIAKDLLKDKNYDEALAKFAETVSVAREYGDDETAAKAEELIPQIYMQKGGSLLNAKDFAGAAEAYKKAVELDPDNGIALLRLGMALDGADRDDEAVEAYKAAAAAGQEKNANAQLGKFYLKRSVASLKAKKYADAVKDAVTSNEYVANPQALQVAGQASQLSGKNADAIKYFEQYLEAAPNAKNAGQIAYTVGALYQQAKNNAKAKEYFSKATSDPKFGADAQKALNSLK